MSRFIHSIWDRLVVADPDGRPPATPAAELAILRDEVRRDLERLLNSRRFHTEDELRAPHLDRSLLAYGIPELSAFNPNSASDLARLKRDIDLAIGRFEPRLHEVKLDYQPGGQGRHLPRIHLRIHARLRVKGASGPVEFDTELDLGSRAFEVRR